MSWQACELVWGIGGLTPVEKLVALCYARRADKDGRNAYPSIPTVACECSILTSSAREVVRRLQRKAVLVEEAAAHGRRPTTYRICVPEGTGAAGGLGDGEGTDGAGGQEAVEGTGEPGALPDTEGTGAAGGHRGGRRGSDPTDGNLPTPPAGTCLPHRRGRRQIVQISPDQSGRGTTEISAPLSGDPSTSGERTPPATLSPAADTHEDPPDDDGYAANYDVVLKLGWTIVEQHPCIDGGELAERLKERCARLGIEVGPHYEVVHKVVPAIEHGRANGRGPQAVDPEPDTEPLAKPPPPVVVPLVPPRHEATAERLRQFTSHPSVQREARHFARGES